jgi:hypothetical protein
MGVITEDLYKKVDTKIDRVNRGKLKVMPVSLSKYFDYLRYAVPKEGLRQRERIIPAQ